MKSFHSLLLLALIGCIHSAYAEDAKYYACYKNKGSLTKKSTIEFNSRGACRTVCVNDDQSSGGLGFSVQAMSKGTDCYCGNKLPADAYKVDDDLCKQKCPGFPTETCGSRLGEYFSVYTSGLEEDPEKDDPPKSSSSSSSSAATKTSTTASTPSSTDSTSASPTASAERAETSTTQSKGSKPNTAGVAVAAVVGVLFIIGLSVGAWFLIRKRRRQKVEEEYRKSAAIRGYTQKPASDHRLDPAMVQRRDSVGSIADNQDYSRRILKVTNPDG